MLGDWRRAGLLWEPDLPSYEHAEHQLLLLCRGLHAMLMASRTTRGGTAMQAHTPSSAVRVLLSACAANIMLSGECTWRVGLLSGLRSTPCTLCGPAAAVTDE